MTPQELTQLLTQSGPFKVPLTYQVFQAIRSMTTQEEQAVVDAQMARKDAALLAKKNRLTAELQRVQAEIDAKPVVDGGVV